MNGKVGAAHSRANIHNLSEPEFPLELASNACTAIAVKAADIAATDMGRSDWLEKKHKFHSS
jgi:hypothetical protein